MTSAALLLAASLWCWHQPKVLHGGQLPHIVTHYYFYWRAPQQAWSATRRLMVAPDADYPTTGKTCLSAALLYSVTPPVPEGNQQQYVVEACNQDKCSGTEHGAVVLRVRPSDPPQEPE